MKISHRWVSAVGLATAAAVLTSCLAAGSTAQAAPVGPSPVAVAAPASPQGGAVPNSYVVRTAPGQQVATLAATAAGVKITRRYSSVITGFAATMSAQQADQLRHQPGVLAVEPNLRMHTSATEKLAPGVWSLDRIDQPKLPLNGTYSYRSRGYAVPVYVVDTGIDLTHPEFAGRATRAFDAFGGDSFDCHGHGTHVAGSIGSVSYGVAKSARLRAVRVLDCQGNGDLQSFIAGLEYIKKAHPAGKPGVVNMSLQFSGRSETADAAVKALADAGLGVAVAAGNSNGANACDFSPASAGGNVLVVGSHDRHDRLSYFSNVGPCVDVFGPGEDILSTVPGGGKDYKSGTSMATPHVAGVLALLMGVTYKYDAAKSSAWIVANAGKGAVKGLPSTTVNRLLSKAAL